MNHLKLSIFAILFLMTVLFTPTFAQEADADGDGVLDNQDLCPREKGTKENKGCPSKNAEANKKVVQAENQTKPVSQSSGKFAVGEIVDLQSQYIDTYWYKAKIIEIVGDKYKVRNLRVNTIEIVSAQKIRPFTTPVKYEIGQKVESMNRGVWYKGEIIGIEPNDHYRIRFEATTISSDNSNSDDFIRPLTSSSTAQTKQQYSSPLWIEKFGISEQLLAKKMLNDASNIYEGCVEKYNTIIPPTRLETPFNRSFSNEGGSFGEESKILLTYAIGTAGFTRIKIINPRTNQVRYTSPQVLIKIRETGENDTKINFNSIILEFNGSDSYQIEAEPNNDDYTGLIKFVCNAKKSSAATGSQTTLDSAANSTSTNKCVSGDCRNGYGKFIYPDGIIYEGNFVNGSPNGKGKAIYANGNIYEGDFVNGNQEGQGTQTQKNGAVYIGQFADGNYNGKGKITYLNGNTYEGDFVNHVRTQGTMTFKKGAVYIGQFGAKGFNGRGKITYSDGDIYDGNWVDDKKEGQAIMTFKSGQIYIGQFSNDVRNGKGKLTYPNGNIYDGNWVDDKREGQGTYTNKYGNYYTGEWKNDKQNGYGKEYVKATNAVREGTWKDGVFVGATEPN